MGTFLVDPRAAYTRVAYYPLPQNIGNLPYLFLAEVTQLFSRIILFNYCICILTSSPGFVVNEYICYMENWG